MLICDLPAQNSAKVGSIFVPSSAIESTASNSLRLLTFEAEHGVSFVGSCTLFKIKGKRYIATTRHQLNLPSGEVLNSKSLDQVRVSTNNNGKLTNILTDRCIFETSNPEQEYHDLLILCAADCGEQTVNDEYAYFSSANFSKSKRIHSFGVGYPSFANSINYENNHLKSAVASRNCIFDQNYKSHADYLIRYKCPDTNFDYDGFSGGAVFSLVQEAGGYELMLDGIIVRAGNGHIYSISSDFLMTICCNSPPLIPAQAEIQAT